MDHIILRARRYGKCGTAPRFLRRRPDPPYPRAEIGGGRTPRQPGQGRKAAATTSSAPGRRSVSTFPIPASSVSRPFSSARACGGRHGRRRPPRHGAEDDLSRDPEAPGRRDRRPTCSARAARRLSADASAAYTVIARKYRPQTFEDLDRPGGHGPDADATPSPPAASPTPSCSPACAGWARPPPPACWRGR